MTYLGLISYPIFLTHFFEVIPDIPQNYGRWTKWGGGLFVAFQSIFSFGFHQAELPGLRLGSSHCSVGDDALG